MTTEAWDDVIGWDRALRHVCFTGQEGRPVYLDMDEDRLAAIALELRLQTDEVERQLLAAVRETPTSVAKGSSSDTPWL